MDALVLGADEGRSRDTIRLGEVRQPAIRGFPNGETRPADITRSGETRAGCTKAGHPHLNI